jgi:hypothetical protein
MNPRIPRSNFYKFIPDSAVELTNLREQCGILKTITLVQDVQVVQPLRSVQNVFGVALLPRAREGLVSRVLGLEL